MDKESENSQQDVAAVNQEETVSRPYKVLGKLKKIKKRWIFLGILTLLIYQCLYPYPMFYFAKSIDAEIVDVDTNEPIEDVIVVAFWLLDGGWEGGSNRGTVNVLETTSDANGKFYFDSWGPRKIPHWFSWDARLKGDSPQILFYKKGYYPRQLRDRYKPSFFVWPITDSDWDGKQIKMQKFEGDATDIEYSLMIGGFNSVLKQIVRHSSSTCEWSRFPKMITETIPVGRFKEANLYSYLLGREEMGKDQGCPSFKEFIKEYTSEENP